MSSEALKAKLAIHEAFSDIGKSSTTKMPDNNKNTYPIAAEFAIAKQLRSMAEKRWDVAKKAAANAGILGDDDDYIVGDTVVVFNCQHFDVTAKKANPSRGLDKAQLMVEMLKHLPEKKVAAIMKAAEKENKGAVTFDIAYKS
jgi:hypothetical protein